MDIKFSPDSIRPGRHLKRLAQEKSVNLSGVPSGSFNENCVPVIEAWIDESLRAQGDWLRGEWLKVAQYFSKSEEMESFSKIVEVFRASIIKRLKLYARATNTPPESIVTDQHLLQLLFGQAAFDFIMSLRISARFGESYQNALDIAGLSHWVSPTDILRIRRKYGEDVGESVIKCALVSYPIDPEGFIRDYLERVEDLQSMYSEKISPGVIRRIARKSPKHPERAIEKYLAVLHSLNEEYADKIDDYVIKHAALHAPDNPRRFIERYLAKVARLIASSGGQVSEASIRRGVFSNPDDLEAAMRSARGLRDADEQ